MYSKDTIELIQRKRDSGQSIREIALHLQMPKSSVHNILNKDCSKVLNKSGPKMKVTQRICNKIKRTFRKAIEKSERVTAQKLLIEANVEISERHMQRTLNKLGLTYKVIEPKLNLKKHHKEKRVKLCKQWITDSVLWKSVVFTDEKRFKLDGPDNMRSWVEVRNGNVLEPHRIKRQLGGGGIMVWGLVLSDGTVRVERLMGNIDSWNYIDLLEKKVIPLLRSRFGEEKFTFQQDNCSIHNSYITHQWLVENQIQYLEWPALSPDLNIIENVWHMISTLVYDKGHFINTSELWNAVQDAAEHITLHKKFEIANLFRSMSCRCLKVIEANGSTIKY